MTTKLNNTAALILTFLGTTTGASAAQIAEAIKKSESVVRENLVKLTAAKSVEFGVHGKTKVFCIPAAKEDDLLSDKPKAKGKKLPKSRVKGLILPTSAKGHPSAKKVVNPQPTLEIKKLAVKQAKGTMVWANRVWVITVPGRESQVVHSRELAKMTVGELCKMFGIAVPTSTTPTAA
jgi:hypothetical protein